MSWYYITAGLSLFAMDYVIRLLRPILYTANLQVLRPCGNGNVVQLSYTVTRPASVKGFVSMSKDGYETAPLKHLYGQYVSNYIYLFIFLYLFMKNFNFFLLIVTLGLHKYSANRRLCLSSIQYFVFELCRCRFSDHTSYQMHGSEPMDWKVCLKL